MAQQIITVDTVRLDVDAGADPPAVIGFLAGALGEAGRTTDASDLVEPPWPGSQNRRPGCPAASPSRMPAPNRSEASLAMARLAPSRLPGTGRTGGHRLPRRTGGVGQARMKLLSALARALGAARLRRGSAFGRNPERIVELVDGASLRRPRDRCSCRRSSVGRRRRQQ